MVALTGARKGGALIRALAAQRRLAARDPDQIPGHPRLQRNRRAYCPVNRSQLAG